MADPLTPAEKRAADHVLDAVRAEIHEAKQAAEAEAHTIVQEAEGFADRLRKLPINPRTITAFVVLIALIGLVFVVLPDIGALGSWLSTHSLFMLQAAVMGLTSVFVLSGILLLLATILDPLTIRPEWTNRFLAWFKRSKDGEKSDQDGKYMIAGAIFAAGTSIMIGLIVLAVFNLGAA